MPNGISNSDLIDLQRTTLQNLPDMEFEVALTYQEYNVINKWFGQDKKQIESGTEVLRNIMLDTSGNAKHVRLYQKTPINVADVQTQLKAPWCQVQTHYSIERREALRNRAPARYIDLLKSRRIDATLDLANLLEARAWSTPNNSSDDLNPRGLPYWISKCDTNATSTGGFNGIKIRWADGSAADTTTKGGINQTTNTKWQNWCATYDAINSEFVKRMRRAFHATNFRSPMTVTDMKQGPASNYGIYMGLNVLVEYEDLATKQNDNNGNDLDKFHGNTVFRRVPILYTPQLDSDTDDPVYGVNHAKFYPVVLDGDWMRESDPMMDVEQHNVVTTFVDGSYQFISINVREGGFSIHKATTT